MSCCPLQSSHKEELARMTRHSSPPRPNGLLRQAREARGWSQDQLAERLGTNGFTVCRWERGHALPSPYYRQQLSELLAQAPEALGLLPRGARSAESSLSPQHAAPPVTSPPEVALVRDPLLPPPPALTTGLIGREPLLAHLKARLLSGETLVLSALQGLPGVGKTALALALAHDPEVNAHFADGVLWAGLGQTPPLYEILARWGTLLGLSAMDTARLSTIQAWAQALRAAIGQRRLLLVLDDAWSLEEVLACQVGGARCALLVTTRRLDLALQVAGAGPTTVPELEESAGLTLLARLAPQVVEAEPEEAHALVRAVGGLPLGLFLLGNYLRVQTHADQPRRVRMALESLHQGTERLQLAQPQVPAQAHPSLPAGTPLSLQASIGLSVTILSPEAQAMLAALALFPPKPNSFSEEAALAVSAGTAGMLDVLVDAGLVESVGAGRYSLHQTIVDYTHLHGQPLQAAERMVKYWIAFVETTHQDYAALDRDVANILAGLQLACERGPAAFLVRGVQSIVRFLELRGQYPLADRLLTCALDAAKDLADERAQLTCLLSLARLAGKQGEYARAEILSQEGVALARAQGHPGPLSALLLVQGGLAQDRGAIEQADIFFQEGAALARQSGDRATLSSLLREVGDLAIQRGDLARAEAVYQEGLQAAHLAGDLAGQSALLQALGGIAAQRGEAVHAVTYREEALRLARQVGDRERIVSLLTDLGLTAGNRAEFAQARVYFTEGLALSRALGQQDLQCKVLARFGGVLLRQGERDEAQGYLQEGLTIARALGHYHWICTCLWYLSLGAIASGRLDEATATAQEGLTLTRSVGNRELEGYLLWSMGWAALQQEAYRQAEAYLQEALLLNRATGARWILPLVLNRLGEVYLQQQAVEQAISAFQEALDLARSQEAQDVVVWASFGLARVAAVQGNRQEALHQGERCLHLAEAQGLAHQVEDIRQWLNSLEQAAAVLNMPPANGKLRSTGPEATSHQEITRWHAGRQQSEEGQP